MYAVGEGGVCRRKQGRGIVCICLAMRYPTNKCFVFLFNGKTMIDNLILGILVLDKPIYAGQYHSISFNIIQYNSISLRMVLESDIHAPFLGVTEPDLTQNLKLYLTDPKHYELLGNRVRSLQKIQNDRQFVTIR